MRGRDDLLEGVEVALETGDRQRGGAGRVRRRAHDRARATRSSPSERGDRVELVPAGGLVEQLRAVKDDDEVSAIRASAAIADDLYRWLISEHGLVGHTERDVASRWSDGRRTWAPTGCRSRRSSPPRRTAPCRMPLPAATPRSRATRWSWWTSAACSTGYCSDCTRTFATGEIDEEAREAYELVRSAQEAALGGRARRRGRAGRGPRSRATAIEAGRARRAVRPRARPRRRASRCTRRRGSRPPATGSLEAGNVVTVEPGVYVPERFGVRIEDLVVVTEDGPRC